MMFGPVGSLEVLLVVMTFLFLFGNRTIPEIIRILDRGAQEIRQSIRRTAERIRDILNDIPEEYP